jgi:hypothetical protein
MSHARHARQGHLTALPCRMGMRTVAVLRNSKAIAPRWTDSSLQWPPPRIGPVRVARYRCAQFLRRKP